MSFQDEVINLNPGCFYGHIVRRRDVCGFTLSESRYAPGTKISAHSHSRAYLCILLNGSYCEEYDRRDRYCSASTVIFHPAGEVHSDHLLSAGGTIFRFEIGREWLNTTRGDSRSWDEPLELAGGSVAWLATRLYAEFTRMDVFSPLVIQGMVLEILGRTARQTQRTEDGRPVWLKRVTEFLHECPPEELTVAKVADVASVHIVHLARVFRRLCGCSVGEYIRQLRIEYAAHELRSSQRGSPTSPRVRDSPTKATFVVPSSPRPAQRQHSIEDSSSHARYIQFRF